MRASEGDIDEERENVLRSSFKPERIEIPQTGQCRWYAIESLKSADISDSLVLELSAILENPYVQDQHGLFARFSYGGQRGAGWYWVALEQQQNIWRLVDVRLLDVYDN